MGLLIFIGMLAVTPALSLPGMKVQVIGSKVFRSEMIREKILSKFENQILDARQLDKLKFQLLGLYRQAGFIEANLNFEKPSTDLIICHIEEGPQIVIGKIEILGGGYFSNDFLRRKIIDFVKDNQIEPSWIDYDHEEIGSILNPHQQLRKKTDTVFFEHRELPFNKSQFLKVKEYLENFYLDQGFLEVQFFGPKESEIHEGHWVDLQFRVDEGAQTLVTKINFLGEDPKFEKPSIKIGDPMNLDLVEDLRVSVEEFFWNQGYPHAEVSSEVTGSEISYQINLGDRIRIEQIEIVGNVVTKKQVIERRIKIKTGDWYSLEKLSETRSNILQTDLFSEVNLELNGTTLLVEVKERERNTFELGIGASFEDGPRATGIWQHRNIFGLGIMFRTRAQLNYPALFYDLPVFYLSQVRDALKSQTSNYLAGRVSAGFLYSKMLWVPFDLDSSIDFIGERALKPAYVLNKASSVISFFTQALPKLRLTPQLEVEYANFDCPTCLQSNQNLSVRLDNGIVKQATLKLLTLWDNRDNSFFPKRGYAVEFNTDFGFGSTESTPVSYVKLVTGVTNYLSLVKQLTWVFNARAGGIWNFSEDTYVPLFKRFYLGGTSTLRGFAEDQIFPVDATQNSLVSLGGSYVVLMRNEIRFPIATDLEGGIFIDTGELMQNISNFGFEKLAVGTGFGIRYQTPIGPLMFDLGMRVFDDNRMHRGNFWNLFGLHFSIGNSI